MRAFLLISVFSFMKCLDGYDVTQHANWHLLDHEICGESLSDRIIGGMSAGLGQFPWMARIAYRKRFGPINKTLFKCGGSLINSLYLVTAAHCATDLKSNEIALIRLGELDEQTDVDCEEDVCAPPVQDFQPERVISHDSFQHPPLQNDIALIRLDRPAKLHSFVLPICLPHGPLLQKDYVGEIMEVAGWGISSMVRWKTSSVLLHVRVPIVGGQVCQVNLGKHVTITTAQFCAGGQVGFDSCGGDSGGPLMKPEAIDGPPKYYLMGVVSFGSSKCGSNSPAVYTNVAHFVPWILDQIEP